MNRRSFFGVAAAALAPLLVPFRGLLSAAAPSSIGINSLVRLFDGVYRVRSLKLGPTMYEDKLALRCRLGLEPHQLACKTLLPRIPFGPPDKTIRVCGVEFRPAAIDRDLVCSPDGDGWRVVECKDWSTVTMYSVDRRPRFPAPGDVRFEVMQHPDFTVADIYFGADRGNRLMRRTVVRERV